jgi:hypothetical protein
MDFKKENDHIPSRLTSFEAKVIRWALLPLFAFQLILLFTTGIDVTSALITEANVSSNPVYWSVGVLGYLVIMSMLLTCEAVSLFGYHHAVSGEALGMFRLKPKALGRAAVCFRLCLIVLIGGLLFIDEMGVVGSELFALFIVLAVSEVVWRGVCFTVDHLYVSETIDAAVAEKNLGDTTGRDYIFMEENDKQE